MDQPRLKLRVRHMRRRVLPILFGLWLVLLVLLLLVHHCTTAHNHVTEEELLDMLTTAMANAPRSPTAASATKPDGVCGSLHVVGMAKDFWLHRGAMFKDLLISIKLFLGILSPRYSIANRLLTSEDNFNLLCHNLNAFYVRPLTMYIEHGIDMLPKEDMDVIFHNLRNITYLSDRVSRGFLRNCRISRWNDDECSIGQVLLKNVRYFHELASYTDNFPDASAALLSVRKSNTQFDDWLKETKTYYGTTPGYRFLAPRILEVPARRLRVYSNIVAELLANTAASHSDYRSLQEVNSTLTALLPKCVAMEERLASMRLLESVQSKMSKIPFSLAHPDRRWVANSFVTVVSNSGLRMSRFAFLFNDVLLIGRKIDRARPKNQNKYLDNPAPPFRVEITNIFDLTRIAINVVGAPPSQDPLAASARQAEGYGCLQIVDTNARLVVLCLNDLRSWMTSLSAVPQKSLIEGATAEGRRSRAPFVSGLRKHVDSGVSLVKDRKSMVHSRTHLNMKLAEGVRCTSPSEEDVGGSACVHIIMSASNDYLVPMLVSINSIRRNTRRDVFFHLLVGVGDCAVLVTRFLPFFDSLRAPVEIVEFDGTPIRPLIRLWPSGGNATDVNEGALRLEEELNFSRFFLPEIFPSLNRVMYIDPDTLTMDDIGEAFDVLDTNPRGLCFAAVAANQLISSQRLYSFRLNMSDPEVRYAVQDPNGETFNAGVFVAELDAWRKQNITSVAEFWLERNTRVSLWKGGSQGPLLILFYGQWLEMDAAWNYRNTVYLKNPEFLLDKTREGSGMYKLVHFTGSAKPWNDAGAKMRGLWCDFFPPALAGDPAHALCKDYV